MHTNRKFPLPLVAAILCVVFLGTGALAQVDCPLELLRSMVRQVRISPRHALSAQSHEHTRAFKARLGPVRRGSIFRRSMLAFDSHAQNSAKQVRTVQQKAAALSRALAGGRASGFTFQPESSDELRIWLNFLRYGDIDDQEDPALPFRRGLLGGGLSLVLSATFLDYVSAFQSGYMGYVMAALSTGIGLWGGGYSGHLTSIASQTMFLRFSESVPQEANFLLFAMHDTVALPNEPGSQPRTPRDLFLDLRHGEIREHVSILHTVVGPRVDHSVFFWSEED